MIRLSSMKKLIYIQQVIHQVQYGPGGLQPDGNGQDGACIPVDENKPLINIYELHFSDAACVFVSLSGCLLVCLINCSYGSACLFECLFVCLFTCLFVCLSVCLFNRLLVSSVPV